MKRNIQILGAITAAAGGMGLCFAATMFVAPISLVGVSASLFLLGCLMIMAAAKKQHDGY